VAVALERVPRRTEDAIHIVPYHEFLDRPWLGEFAY